MNNSITLGPTGTSGHVGITGFNNTVIGIIGLTGPGRPGPIGMTNTEYRKHLRTKKIIKLLENGI